MILFSAAPGAPRAPCGLGLAQGVAGGALAPPALRRRGRRGAVRGLVAPGAVEGRPGLEQVREHPARGLRIRDEDPGAAAALGADLPQVLAQVPRHGEVGVEHLLTAPAIAHEQILEGQLIKLIGLHALWSTEGKAVVLESASSVRLVSEPNPLPVGRIEQVVQFLEHGVGRERKDLHAWEEMECHQSNQVCCHVCEAEVGAHRGECQACADRAEGAEELLRRAGHRCGVEEEEGVGRAPP
mmetsp:Transcript_94617/g.276573  ORF Transcript_94617/g.276573 Transcript_94617/m.276573 type:complete len:241 (+) Transcript_94617:484-1206(+)